MASLDINVRQANADFQAIKNKIVANGVEVAEGTPTADYAPKIDEVYEAGRKSKVKEHMDTITNNGKRTNCNYMFAYFNDEMFKLEYPIRPTLSQYMFAWATITTPVLKTAWDNGYLDFSQTDMKYLFANTYMTEIPFDVSLLNSETPSYVFGWAPYLHTIKKVIVAETTKINGWFTSCPRLKEVRFEGVIAYSINFSACSTLTNESVQSAIDHLKDLTGATAQTITFHSDVVAKLTDAQLQTIWNKNWKT